MAMPLIIENSLSLLVKGLSYYSKSIIICTNSCLEKSWWKITLATAIAL
jgi:hypothetical protein